VVVRHWPDDWRGQVGQRGCYRAGRCHPPTTNGYELHCDGSLPNNLEINAHDPNGSISTSTLNHELLYQNGEQSRLPQILTPLTA
jgi:hypothetical protein